MERHRTVRDPLLRLRTEIGQLADDPTAVAALIGVQCLFSALYYGALAFGQLDRLLAGEWRPVAAIAGLFVLTVVNAVGVTWIVWRVVDLDSTRSYWYGAGAGLAIGIVSHLTLGFIVAVYGFGSGPPMWMSVQEFALAVPMFAFYIVIFTAGIPILLSLGTGIGLIYCRRQATDNH